MKQVFCFSIGVRNTALLVERFVSSFLLASWIFPKLFSYICKYSINVCGKLWQQGFSPPIENNKKQGLASWCCDRRARAASARSFTLWQQATIEITRRDHSINACSRHKFMMVFFAHVPFVANRTFNATLTERLQHFHAVLVSVSKPVDWAYWKLL